MSEPFIAEVVMFGGNFAPRGWALTDGQLMPISQYSALFSILGTTFGGDGRSTFGIPDLRGRIALHAGRGPGLPDYQIGQKGGANTHTLTASQMPAHNHTGKIKANTGGPNQAAPTGHSLAAGELYTNGAPNTLMANDTVETNNAGGNQGYSIQNPFLGIYHIIAIQGIYPSRS